ncbi:ABC transporter substrate-binding protein [Streptomyces pacificus]|uniref:ABC transporter substrate-binding protein n=1 Tax=Streptomyces pacificus TaxID=2705029 RepID=A0A6A0AN05_9ACTN|nr:ABC transporter substrate-binding protein [Streptomyces pacificus]GFH33978.1 ABC transporter substrate-binding protein [Streptomyces pacificus]
MPDARAITLTRRGLLAAGGALGIGAALTACGGGGGTDSEASAGAGSGASAGTWQFKDDRGQVAEAETTPENIVAFTGTAAALHDFGIEVKGVFGPTYVEDKAKGTRTPGVQAGDLDIDKVEVLGNIWGEFSVEQYAALAPDVLITDMWEKGSLWYVPDESKDKILKLAPSIALSAADRTMPKVLQRHVELAESLGADTGAAKVTDAKAAFEKAAARLRAAARAKPEIKVLVGSASADLFYVSSPARPTDTLYFKELGVNFVTPGNLDEGGWFEGLSWENVDRYPADVIMMDNRASALQPDALKSKPTWAQLPAVQAGQVVPRVTEPIYSYEKCTPILEDLAEAIENATKVA